MSVTSIDDSYYKSRIQELNEEIKALNKKIEVLNKENKALNDELAMVCRSSLSICYKIS